MWLWEVGMIAIALLSSSFYSTGWDMGRIPDAWQASSLSKWVMTLLYVSWSAGVESKLIMTGLNESGSPIVSARILSWSEIVIPVMSMHLG